jgi:hypothetical protein
MELRGVVVDQPLEGGQVHTDETPRSRVA